MTTSFHSIHFNINPSIVDSQKMVMDHFDIPIQHHNYEMRHGEWMDHVIRNSQEDVVVIFDIDCVPLNKAWLDNLISYVSDNKTFVGSAQASNHLKIKNHIYAAPNFFAISRSAFDQLGRPSFHAKWDSDHDHGWDVAQNVSLVAQSMNFKFRVLMPTFYEKPINDSGESWDLGPCGQYGIGTVFDNVVYHLFNSRYQDNINLFSKRCLEIVEGRFTTQGMISCQSLFG
jgi:hypothetical protein